MEPLGPRDEAAIANAMLLGELVTRESDYTFAPAYAFFRNGESHGAVLYDSVCFAAWMFLARLGYGIEPNGTGIVRLRT